MLIDATDLRVAVGGRELFTSLNFEWSEPGIVAVIGPSGAGKSTLLSTVMGWTRPSSGTINVHPSGGTWFVPQNAPLLDSRSTRDNLEVALLAGARNGQSSNAVDQIIAKYQLIERTHTLAKHLSGGERQRVALARAALREPRYCSPTKSRLALTTRT